MRTNLRLAERNNGDRNQRAAQGDDGCEQIERLVDRGRNQVFFKERFCAIDERLQQSKRSNSAWPPAILNAADKFALKQYGISDTEQHHYRYYDYLEQAPKKKL